MNRNIKILLLASLISSLSAGLLGPLYAIFVGSIGGSILDAGGAWATFSLMTGVATIIIGRQEQLNKKLMIVTGFALSAVGTAGYLFIKTPLDLFIVEGILGLALAIINPPFDALYSISLDKGQESTEWAYFEGFTNIALAIAAVGGALIAQLFSFRLLFTLMTILAIAATIASVAIIKNPEVLLGLKPKIDHKKRHQIVQRKLSEYKTVLKEVKKLAPRAVEKAKAKLEAEKNPEPKKEEPKTEKKPEKTVKK